MRVNWTDINGVSWQREYKLLKRTLSDSARAGPQQEVKLHWGLRELARVRGAPDNRSDPMSLMFV